MKKTLLLLTGILISSAIAMQAPTSPRYSADASNRLMKLLTRETSNSVKMLSAEKKNQLLDNLQNAVNENANPNYNYTYTQQNPHATPAGANVEYVPGEGLVRTGPALTTTVRTTPMKEAVRLNDPAILNLIKEAGAFPL